MKLVKNQDRADVYLLTATSHLGQPEFTTGC